MIVKGYRYLNILELEDGTILKTKATVKNGNQVPQLKKYHIDNNNDSGLYNCIEVSQLNESVLNQGPDGSAKSKAQRRLFAMALMHKRGKLDKKYVSPAIEKMSSSMTEAKLREYAATDQKKRKKNGQIGKRNNIPNKIGSKPAPNKSKKKKSLKEFDNEIQQLFESFNL